MQQVRESGVRAKWIVNTRNFHANKIRRSILASSLQSQESLVLVLEAREDECRIQRTDIFVFLLRQ